MYESRQNDFKICVQREYALALLDSTFGTYSISTRPSVQSLIFPIKADENKYRLFVQQLRKYKEQIKGVGIANHCVVIDLCRPLPSSIHQLCLYNPKERSHSNLSNDPLISCLSPEHLDGMANKRASLKWCPRPPSEQSTDGPDFVILTRKTTYPVTIEGVVVRATGPVAIRVELQNRSDEWDSVNGGALLRPLTDSNDSASQHGQNKSLQLIVFPEPYKNFLLEIARITVVECDGREVRLALLVSNTDWSYQCTSKWYQRHQGTDMFVNRTENFDAEDDYRNWWYRLQSIRCHVGRILPDMEAGIRAMRGYDSVLKRVRKKASSSTIKPHCNNHRQKLVVVSVAVHALLLLVLFPILLVLNLDPLTTAHHSSNTSNVTNTTTTTTMNMPTTPDYTMKNPDPHRIMRTICWSTPDNAVLVVPWSVVFAPFLVSMLVALGLIMSRFIDVCLSRRQVGSWALRYNNAYKHSRLCRENVHAQLETRMSTEVGEENGVSNTVQGIVDDFMAAAIDPMPPFHSDAVSKSDFQCVKIHFVDHFALIIGLVAAVIYGVADWGCYYNDVDSEGLAVGVLCILVSLCVAMDVTVGVQFVRFIMTWLESDGWYGCFSIAKRSTFVLFGLLILQQLLLLLEMFTFFHEVSFVLVFLPLLVAIVMFNAIMCVPCDWRVGFITTICCITSFASVVLLMSKADDLFGVGTVSPQWFSEMSWVVVMIPIWVAGCVPLAFGLFFGIYEYGYCHSEY